MTVKLSEEFCFNMQYIIHITQGIISVGFELKALMAENEDVFTGYTVAIVICYVKKMTTTSSLLIGGLFGFILTTVRKQS